MIISLENYSIKENKISPDGDFLTIAYCLILIFNFFCGIFAILLLPKDFDFLGINRNCISQILINIAILVLMLLLCKQLYAIFIAGYQLRSNLNIKVRNGWFSPVSNLFFPIFLVMLMLIGLLWMFGLCAI